ncbi:hypothetical protein NliqN6_2772 [Naganishia liquefaciens]|uniref:CASTOR ACT domain-containing protein n=1 Tax=Naganishia liquefaciens TaxID=104408 RepID=A0A8H3TTH1_9TREE|nr:hypothetical protein NliqN6_2772 [Naganishia liquefaciens]
MTLTLTIQTLPTPIRIVSLLLSPQLHPLSEAVLNWLITFAPRQSPEFFALVSDDVEVCVYASSRMVDALMDHVEGWNVAIGAGAWIEVHDEKWSVLQMDAGDASEELDSSVHLVTASLADAGIRCKYRSSYYADFILVADEQLEKTIALVRVHGWTVDTNLSTPRTPSPPISPHLPAARQARYSTSSLPITNEWITYTDTPARPRKKRPHTADEVVAFGKRVLEEEEMQKAFQTVEIRDDSAEVTRLEGDDDEAKDDAIASLASSGILPATMAVSIITNPVSTTTTDGSADSTTHSLMPDVSNSIIPRLIFRPKVSAPPSKIAVIGLNNATVRQWEHRLHVFLLFPSTDQTRLPSSLTSAPTAVDEKGERPFVACIRTEEGTSLATEIPIVQSLFPDLEERQALVQSGGELGMFDSDDDTDAANESFGRDRSTAWSARSRRAMTMSDSGYGSAFSTPWIDAEETPLSSGLGALDALNDASTDERLGKREPERGVKRCVQLDLRSGIEQVGEGGAGSDAELEQTRLIARINGRLQRQGIGLLYATTYRSATIMVESGYLAEAQRIVNEVVHELDER